MLFLAVGAAGLLALLVWVGRRPTRVTGGARLVSALVSALAAVAAVVSALRGGWIASLALIAASAWLGQRVRVRAAPGAAPPPPAGMSLSEARAILGVSAGATHPEILAAYRRLMQRAHPDHGGSAGLAAQINAARDRLIGRDRAAP
jgi:hypothetical protein